MKKHLNPSRILILGFLSFIAVGTVLLMMPFATVNGITFHDALFTSTSAVCVTGLIVKDTPHDFTIVGQLIILFLIQIGGLGYMTSATIISLMIGKKIGLGERLLMKEALNVLNVEGIVRFTKGVLLVTLICESIGAMLLTIRFMADFSTAKAVYYGIFHAVSAFNNAGFSLFSDSLTKYHGDASINLVISVLVIVGGIGFIVLSDFYNYWRKKIFRLSVHTKVVMATTVVLTLFGAVLIFFFEYSNPGTLQPMSLKEKLFASFFASVTPRTAGFNTVNYSAMRIESLFLTMILMFIGASPGSTGGGLKTTTFAIAVAGLCAIIRNLRDTVMFRRRVPSDVVSKAYLLVVLAFFFIIVVSMIVIRLEHRIYLESMFEVTSAFGTVGLSVGDGGVRSLSAIFSPFGKLLISFAMFAGRLGPLTLAVAVTSKREELFRYPEGKVVIG